MSYGPKGGGPDKESEHGESDVISDDLNKDLGDGAQEVSTVVRKLRIPSPVSRTL